MLGKLNRGFESHPLRHAPHGAWLRHAENLQFAAYNPPVPHFHYVYVLRSLKDGGFYIGSTDDLKARMHRHEGGNVRATKSRRPFELIFYEAYRSLYDAKRREIYLKTSKGKTALGTMLRFFLAESDCSEEPGGEGTEPGTSQDL